MIDGKASYMQIARLLFVLVLATAAMLIVSLSALANAHDGRQSNPMKATESSDASSSSTANTGATIPTLSIETMEGEEGFGLFAFYVTLSQPSAVNVTGKVSTSNITATAPADFTALSNQPFTITAGATETFIYVNIVDDNFHELTETFKVSVTQISNATANPVEGGGWAYGHILDDDTTPAVSISDNTVNESAGAASMVLTLSAPHTSDASVTLQTFEDSANSGLDFVGTTKTITIASGQISTTVPITIENDSLDENSEQFFVRITGSSVLIEDDEATVTIIDDDAPPNLSVQPISAPESDLVLIFQVTLDAVSGRNVTGRANTSNGTAQSSLDYAAVVNKLFTIPSGITETTIYVPVNDETLYEGDETLTLSVTNVNNANVSIGSNIGTILNDDQAPTLSIDNATANESASLEFVISLDEESAVDVSGTFSTTNNTATAGSDFVAVSNEPFTIPAGTLTTTITVDLINDFLYEESEMLTVTVGSLLDATPGALLAVGFILDNDPLPYLSINDVSGNEGSPNMTFTLSISTVSSIDVTGFVNTLNATAVQNQDYTTLSIYPFTITAGITSTQVVVNILDDVLDEENETFIVSVVNLEYADIFKEYGTGTIIDNDAMPNLTISSTSFAESSSGIVTVTLDTVSGRSVTGSLNTQDGSAKAILDYGPLSEAMFTIPAGQLSTIVEFYIINDVLDEDDEDFQVALSTVNNAIATNSAISVTLFDDDAPPTISVINISTDESQATINIPVRLSQPSGKTITGTLSTSDGSAISPDDYTAISLKPFTITKGQTEALVAISLINDSLHEIDEVFVVTLQSAGNATIGTATANATIVDNDSPPVLTISDFSGSEASGSFTFTISTNAVSSLAVTGKASTSNGSAVAGNDFIALSNFPFSIAPGSTSTTIHVIINNDISDEYDEQFFVTLSNIANAQVGDNVATGTIIDNDAPPTVTIANASASEGAGNLVFNISISVASGKEIKLQVNTFDNTAQSPSDYIKQSDRSFTIAAGKSSETIKVAVIDDPSDEPDETMDMQIALIDPTTAMLVTTSVVGTIIDNDLPPTLTVADVSASETSGQMIFTLKLSAPSAFEIYGTVDTKNGSASAGADYFALDAQSFNIPIGSTQTTIAIALINDLLLESSETFTFTVGELTGASKLDPTAIGTIQDDDSSGTGTLIIEVDVTPKSIQNFKFASAFASEFYLDDENEGEQSDSYTNKKSFSLAAGNYLVTPTTPYSYFLMDIVCSSGGVIIKTGTALQLPVLGSGQTVTCSFVNQRGITIRSQSYNDLSKNRLYDKADAALAGVETKLYINSETNPVKTETSDSSGKIDWSYRKPGSYTVCAANWPLAVPLMVQPTLLDSTYGLPCYRFNLRPGSIADVYFGFRVDDGTVVAAIEGMNEFDPSLNAGSVEEGVLFSQMPDVTDDMQGYEETTSNEEPKQQEQSVKLYLPVVTR